MKILFVVDGLWVGGTERSLSEMMKALRTEGFETIVACLRHTREGVEGEVLKQGMNVKFLESKSFFSKSRELRRLIRSQKPHLIHTSLFESNMLARISAISTGVPVLTSLVNTPYEPVRYQDPSINPLRLRVVQAIDSWSSRHLTSHFHAVSNAAKQSAMKKLGIPPERITVVERGRDPVRLSSLSQERRVKVRQSLGFSSNDLVLINVGRQDYQKGQRFLLEAVAGLRVKYPGLKLIIAGRNGGKTSELQSLANKLELYSSVKFLGHVDNVPEFLAASDIFVFPSLYEGLPGAVIEAMALELPIVASNIPPVLEVIEPGLNAVLFQPASTSSLIEILEPLLRDPELRQKYGKRSRGIFIERFTLEKSVQKMMDLYHQLADKR